MQLDPISILIVDDEESIRMVLSAILTDTGYQCAVCPDALQGIEYLKTHSVDLIISDIVLPQMHGTEFARVIRQMSPDTETILITGLPDTATAIDGIRSRVFDYIIKPFTPEIIRDRVSRAVAFIRMRRENLRHKEHLEKLVDERSRELERLTSSIIGLQEAATQHLAREIHDNIGQSLLALKLDLHEKASALEGSARKGLEESIEYVGKIISDCRNLSHNLSPAALSRLGLTSAIEDVLAVTCGRMGIQTKCSLGALENFDAGLYGTNLFRVIQEAVTNACKHSQCTQLSIEAEGVNGSIHVRISDNGHGFRPGEDPRGIGLGLMRERAGLLGGKMSIEANSAGGTTIHVEFPKHENHTGG